MSLLQEELKKEKKRWNKMENVRKKRRKEGKTSGVEEQIVAKLERENKQTTNGKKERKMQINIITLRRNHHRLTWPISE